MYRWYVNTSDAPMIDSSRKSVERKRYFKRSMTNLYNRLWHFAEFECLSCTESKKTRFICVFVRHHLEFPAEWASRARHCGIPRWRARRRNTLCRVRFCGIAVNWSIDSIKQWFLWGDTTLFCVKIYVLYWISACGIQNRRENCVIPGKILSFANAIPYFTLANGAGFFSIIYR